ncbi:MAG: hypothetical protein J1E34_03105 [Oscillospiraceae bacterium]|nr:hypothetical protein [Oscillospiraceae bacterium]
MKKKSASKIISVILVISLVLVPIFSLSANAAENETVRDCPQIDIHGFMASHILKDKNDPSKGYVFEYSADDILSMLKKALPAMLPDFVLNNWEGVSNKLIPIFEVFFDGMILNPDGTANGNSGLEFTYPPRESITDSSKLAFCYDWRLDPIDSAAKLNDYINYVLECSGADKVTLTCHSLGGIITTSYIKLYGDKKIKSVVYDTTAVYGETYTGELLSGNLTLNADAIEYYLRFAFEGNEFELFLNGLISILNDIGILDAVCAMGNDLIEKLSPYVLPKLIVPMFAGLPTIWAMVPDEFLDDSLNYVFGTVYENDEVDRSGLIEKIENYNNLIRADKTQTLQKLNEDVNLYVISRYGYSSIPVGPSYMTLTDSTIDTKRSSFGATTADYLSVLTDEQLADFDPTYVSPDKMVYAGTCLFPDQTWFVKNYPHAESSGIADMMASLLYYDGQADINTFAEYPQFLKYNRNENSVSPLTAADVEATVEYTFFERMLNFISDFASKILAFIQVIADMVTGITSAV